LLKQLTELRAKKAEGKLTPNDEKRLAALEQAEKAMQAHPLPGKPAEKPADKSTEKPVEPGSKPN
jgi:hypothetical protein